MQLELGRVTKCCKISGQSESGVWIDLQTMGRERSVVKSGKQRLKHFSERLEERVSEGTSYTGFRHTSYTRFRHAS